MADPWSYLAQFCNLSILHGSALHATAVARGDGIAPGTVVVVVEEDLLQNCLEGVGLSKGDGGPNVGRGGMVEQDGVEHGAMELKWGMVGVQGPTVDSVATYILGQVN